MNATALVYLASAFDRVFVAPSGMVSFLGFDGTQMFFRRLLDKIGVAPRVFRREEYKSAMAPFVGEGFDRHHRWGVGPFGRVVGAASCPAASACDYLPPICISRHGTSPHNPPTNRHPNAPPEPTPSRCLATWPTR
jgi:hypothetical protein